MRYWAALYVAALTFLSLAVLGGMFVLGVIALALYALDVIHKAW